MKKAEFVQQIVTHVDVQIKALGQTPEPELQEEMYASCMDLISRKITVQSAYRAGTKILAAKKVLLRKNRDKDSNKDDKDKGPKSGENDQKSTIE